jgi:glycogen debranching enzyme
MERQGAWWVAPAPAQGTRYGLRAAGAYAPEQGLWFDPAKLLVDPYAKELDAPFIYDPRLAHYGIDTADIVPKAVYRQPEMPPPAFSSESPPPAPAPPSEARAYDFIYEINVRAFTLRHPDVPPDLRGTIAALAHPSIIAHLHKLHVDAIELMPIVAWMDERHLHDLGLANAWGYNPIALQALEPRLCPGGVEELRRTLATLHAAGIGVILDMVFNHSGESDAVGETLSMRGLANLDYYVHAPDGALRNMSGCGNTLNCAHPHVRALVLDTLRHFAALGVDGFRFDLAPILAREPEFNPHSGFFTEIAQDPVLSSCMMIAEPWDCGWGGYQLGQFPHAAPIWWEWNDRYRDDVRRFWLQGSAAGALATRLAGSSDIFGGEATRSVNFIAAHDGFTLHDLVTYKERHNEANGEQNRDGTADNHSYNFGVEGESPDAAICAKRDAAKRALLATLFASRGAIMLTAGDEFGRTQRGNNNAYAQDNDISWLDWAGRDVALEDYVAGLAAWRAAHKSLSAPKLQHDILWLTLEGDALTKNEWENPALQGFVMQLRDGLRVSFNRASMQVELNP